MVHKSRIAEIRAIIDREADARPGLDKSRLQLEKWRLIHKHVHDNPFPTNARLSRADQWRAALDRIRDMGDMDLLDWVLLQIEVAGNLERGVQDMRPRKGGPCHGLLMEFIRDRKRKALAVHKWLRAESS